MKKHLPLIIVAVFTVWVIASLWPRESSAFHTGDFGKLPVLRDGRIKPFDTVARDSLRQLRNKQSVPLGGMKTMTATEWLLEVMMKPEAADGRKVFRIDNDEVKSLLKLPVDQKHFSFNEINPNYAELSRQGQRIGALESNKRTVFENQTYKLFSAAMLYQQLKVTLKPPQTDDFMAELAAYRAAIEPGMAAVRAQRQGQSYDTNAFDALVKAMSDYDSAARFSTTLCIPPLNPEHTRNDWKNIGTVLMDAVRGTPLPPAVEHFAAMITAYRQDKPAVFNQALADYRQWLGGKMAPEVRKGREEYVFNFADPFYKAAWLYVAALLAGFAFWMFWAGWTRRTAFNLVALAWVLHTIGLLARMYLEKRPPVTNLYSSAVFIGWGAVLLGIILERVYRIGIGVIVAAVIGFVTQVIALNLAIGGDTMEMMRAVLDSNFWLATHVVTITIGYSAMFVAGLLALQYILSGIFTDRLTRRIADQLEAEDGGIKKPAPTGADQSGDESETVGQALARMTYAIVCLATLFSFVGTVLGGIWADQSWGRFWGWDPKENGALLIVIWCAVILHARWSGMVKERGLMILAIIGNVITAWSWFGVNMLGVGLHSYGFMDSAFKWLVIFAVSQLAIIGIGLLPLKIWASFRNSPDLQGGSVPVK